MTRSIAASILILSVACGCATSPEASVAPVDRSQVPGPAAKRGWAPPKVETWQMKNGLEVWFVEQRHTSLAKLYFVLPNGHATDPAGKEGLTELTTDLMNEGAGTRSALELSKEFQRLGTDYGASVDLDTVTHVLDLLPDGFDDSVKLLADILRNPTFKDEEFKRRQEQLIATNLSSEARPSTGRSRAMRFALFGDGYAAYRGKGTSRTLKVLTNSDVKKHYAGLIAPTGAKIVVVGALSKGQVRKGLEDAFGDWSGVPTVTGSKLVEKAIEPKVYFVDYPGAAQSSILVATRAQGTDDVQQRFAKKLYARVIAGAFSSRINMNLREDKGYTYGARGGFGRYRETGYFAVGASVKTDTTLASLIEIKRELQGVGGDKPLSVEEFNEAKKGLLLGYPNRFETISSVARELSALIESGKRPDELETWSKSVGSVAQKNSQEIAKSLASIRQYVIVVAGDRARVEESLKSLGVPIVYCGRDGRPVGNTAETTK